MFRSLLGLICACAATSAVAGASLADTLVRLAPDADPRVIGLALQARRCAAATGVADADRLAVIDYSRPSTARRLWVFDLARPRLLFDQWVAHGRNSGGDYAQHFSNAPESLESSLGLFLTLGAYDGHNGYSLRLQGLEPGFNDAAYRRDIVIHGASYVDAGMARRQGRLGRSWGCPAVNPAVARPLIDTLRGGQLVFAYYPDRRWLSQSRFLHCDAAPPITVADRASYQPWH
jgi:hypothetical protein